MNRGVDRMDAHTKKTQSNNAVTMKKRPLADRSSSSPSPSFPTSSSFVSLLVDSGGDSVPIISSPFSSTSGCCSAMLNEITTPTDDQTPSWMLFEGRGSKKRIAFSQYVRLLQCVSISLLEEGIRGRGRKQKSSPLPPRQTDRESSVRPTIPYRLFRTAPRMAPVKRVVDYSLLGRPSRGRLYSHDYYTKYIRPFANYDVPNLNPETALVVGIGYSIYIVS